MKTSLFKAHPFFATLSLLGVLSAHAASTERRQIVRFRDVQAAEAFIRQATPGSVEAVFGLNYLVKSPFSSLQVQSSSSQGILRVEDDAIFKPFMGSPKPPSTSLPNDPKASKQWALQKLAVVEAWDLLKQNGATSAPVIAILDLGVQQDHPDLRSQIWHNTREIAGNGIDDDANGFIDDVNGWNFADNNNDTSTPKYADHGTHVAGIAVGQANNSLGIAGAAPLSKLMPVKVFSDDANGARTSDIIRGLGYAVRNGDRIVNASLGGPTFSQAFQEAVADANAHGVLFVAAAGNGGDDGRGDDNARVPTYPANFDLPNVVSVAALHSLGGLAPFSNYSATRVHVAAPGESVYSTVTPSDYGYMDGTSMAAPYASAMAALALMAAPQATPEQLRSILIRGSVAESDLNGAVVANGSLHAPSVVRQALALRLAR